MSNFLWVELCDLSTSVFCWLIVKSGSISHLYKCQKQPVFTVMCGERGDGEDSVVFLHHTDLVGWWRSGASVCCSFSSTCFCIRPEVEDGGWRMEDGGDVLHVSDLHLVVLFLSPEPFSLSLSLFICISSLTFAFVHIQLFEPVWHSSFFWCFWFKFKFSTLKLPVFLQQTTTPTTPF